jgi:Flp pilus assembly protein TadG
MLRSRRKLRQRRNQRRKGTTIVETAIVLPVFLLFVFAIFEFGHAFMVAQVIRAASREGARNGITEGATSAEVISRAEDVLSSAIDLTSVTISVKDGSSFDSPSPPTDVSALPDVEVADLETGDLFIVYVEVPYSAVRVIDLRFLVGQRHFAPC